MSVDKNNDLIVACNILFRVESLVEPQNRVQLSKETLTNVNSYLIKAIKHIDSSIPEFSLNVIELGKIVEFIDSVINKEVMEYISVNTKEALVERLCPTIKSFELNVGKYLTEGEGFEFKQNKTNVLKRIVDDCINMRYYFGY